MNHPIVFGEPQFDDLEEDRVLSVLRSRWIGQGPVVREFEDRFAAYVGAPECVAVSSCTAALELALLAAGIGPGDEVVTTPFTFVATVNAIDRVGAHPVLVDIDRATLNLEPDRVAGAVGARTRAVVPVDFGGRPVDRSGFGALCRSHSLWLVEDAAHAVGAVAHGARIGRPLDERHLTCFSFYPNKNLASAEGGAITCSDPELAERLRRLRQHGLDNDAWRRYASTGIAASLMVDDGRKANWTDLQAAIALVQLDKLEGFLAVREVLAERYDELLADGAAAVGIRPLERPAPGLDQRHALHLYQVIVDGTEGRRDRVLVELRHRGVGAAVHYLAVHLHPRFRDRWPTGFPNAEWASRHVLSLPLHPGLSDTDVERVVTALFEVARSVT